MSLEPRRPIAPPASAPSQPQVGSSPRPRHSLAPLAPRSYYPGLLVAEKYELVQPLGEGGMGTVWKARNRVLDVPVALKLIPLGRNERTASIAARMLEEARTAARLGHPAIVRVLDYGQTQEGDPFIALELLRGEDLADVLARERRLPALRAVQVLLPIAHALATAHEHGIVHRDVKPENIFLVQTNLGLQPKLLDFGIARFLDRPQRLTLEGAAVGTPDYMSPEQARGEELGSASDVWSFGVVLFELVTGYLPFRGDNHLALLRAIVEAAPLPLPPGPNGQERLAPIIERCLSKDPRKRFPSMMECGQALARWLQEEGVVDDITGSPLRRVWDPHAAQELDHRALRSNPNLDAPTPISVPAPPSSGTLRAAMHGEQELHAIASLGALGDAERRLARQASLRQWGTALTLLLLLALALGAMLWSGGTFAAG